MTDKYKNLLLSMLAQIDGEISSETKTIEESTHRIEAYNFMEVYLEDGLDKIKEFEGEKGG